LGNERLEIFSGFESTRIVCPDRPRVDVLELSRHLEYTGEDLRLVRDTGLTTLRYSAPWHRIQPAEDAWDWSWMDRAMACIRSLGIDPILDPLHHVSFPAWLEGGFLNPRFEEHYLGFCVRLARRYPGVRRYTIVNEPLVTSWLCGHEGVWYPYGRSARSFVRMVFATARSIARVKAALDGILGGVELVHADSCEEHRAAHPAAAETVEFMNRKRFLVLDLLAGRVDRGHPLHAYLAPHVSEEAIAWFRDHPTRIDELGLNYYPHSEWLWGEAGAIVPHPSPRGFAAVALAYLERYAPETVSAFSLAETNIRGTVRDRCTWP
jgi:beta-glucosidase/6-phospho-beta-glucosidase/beta-galactosidase